MEYNMVYASLVYVDAIARHKVIVLILELGLEAHMRVEGARWPLDSVNKLTADNRIKLLRRSLSAL